MIRLLIGLGNPGPEYVFTRHNIGWLYIDHLIRGNDIQWQEKFNGVFCRMSLASEQRYLLKPLTYMNRSGYSISAMMQYFQISKEEVLVVHDDLELPFGTFAFKFSGGLGGHNGLRSITSQLGTPDFGRLRIGIGRPAHSNVTAYVLGPFLKEEEVQIDRLFERITDHLGEMLDGDFSHNPQLNVKLKGLEGIK